MIYDYEYFKKEIYSLTTIDLNAYKEKQMKRRIDTLIAKHKIVGYDKYVQALKTDKVLFEEFVGYITINVSEFYRNPEQWKYLEETVIPELIQRFGKNLKVWSAACSTGDEPYSLVMALSRHIPLQQIRIYRSGQTGYRKGKDRIVRREKYRRCTGGSEEEIFHENRTLLQDRR
jgi:chemotaxis protein methyltransferase CheR